MSFFAPNVIEIFMKRRNDQSQPIKSTNFDTIDQIEKNYMHAKTLLAKINKNFKTESTKKRKNSVHLAKVKAAKDIENQLSYLVRGVVNFYSKSEHLENQLRAVKIAIEFVHLYPINEQILYKELSQLYFQLDLCKFIYKTSSEQKKESQIYIDIINKTLIPQLYCNFALFFNSELKILGQANKTQPPKIPELTQRHQTNILILNSYLSSQPNSPLKDEIKSHIAESYELIADLQYDFID